MTTEAETELPRGLALAWGVAAAPQRGPKREMTVERIVEAAVEIADAEGLSAVSMAAVAARLGYTPMSLYRYVSAKDDLVLLMQEEATGLPSEAVRSAADWREALECYYREQVQSYLDHPWVLDVPITGMPATPNSSAWVDAGLHALADTPLTIPERLAVILLVAGLARWTGIVYAGYARARRDGVGLTDADVARREDALYRALITADAFPDLRAAVDAGVLLGDTDSFAYGLERSLDGVAATIGARLDGVAPVMPAVQEDPTADIAADKRYREAQKAVRVAERALREA
ncbi:TetR/AcrR family transcriptional regulator, partial [Microbacterium sp.]|uniref:TetR/AcrR family transcriptional regulator n=1 Tax=Microbacterium sp. TaxID=51671 RepID=UPI003C7667B0